MDSRRILISVLGFAVGLGAVVIPASASAVVYCASGCGANNQTAFNNAIAADDLFFPNGLQDFSTYSSISYSSGLTDVDTVTGLDFFGYSSTTQVGVTVNSGELEQSSGETGNSTSLGIDFPTGVVYAFEMMITDASNAGSPCVEPNVTPSTFTSGNCNTTVNIPSSGAEFVGVICSTPLTDVFVGSFAGGLPALEIENFELGEQMGDADTPEVATLLLIGTGLGALGLVRRRRTRKGAPPDYDRISRAAASSRNSAASPRSCVINCAGYLAGS